ncbi:EAL domain-containing protein [Xanthobacter autotrophicus]|uniref:putative bifunctional diguanylate cyclase/phosphodiesterase n=1 Tax=Xanthobacter autotrophicus TaxID=280 RepID=UPI001E54555B|nr:EAL domain-containing protein [Xanthobacter autotrophicus]UDQ90293.1 EAL domain-containing protein [Xanthobacter autotrophicus]
MPRRWILIFGSIIVTAIVVFLALQQTHLIHSVFFVGEAHEAWHLHELFAAWIVATGALIAILIVREGQLRKLIIQQRETQKLVDDASAFDSLTGIANRLQFQSEFSRELKETSNKSKRLALLVVDVDLLRSVNEAHGHGAGDDLLRQLAGRLISVPHRGGMVARLGSGEFAVLFPMGADETEELFRLASRILSRLREPFDCNGLRINITASIGISKYPRDGSSATVLLQSAEKALRQAKAVGKDCYALYDSDLDARGRERRSLESEFRHALEAGEIVAQYQPVVRLATGETVGFEALARWRHPKRGILGPAEFIPIAEDEGLIDALFTAMLRRVGEDLATWHMPLRVAVNLSPVQLVDPQLPQRILDLLAKMNIPPGQIELEITETGLLLDFETARGTLAVLKEAGVHVSLDDFGTGFSSLRHLNELPIDKIKIDRSFTRLIATEAQSCKIISSMLNLGRTLELTTVAEGVETREEADFLLSQRCDLGQGYLFARPLWPQEAFATASPSGA